MLIHLNEGTIRVAWLWDDLHKRFSTFPNFSKMLGFHGPPASRVSTGQSNARPIGMEAVH